MRSDRDEAFLRFVDEHSSSLLRTAFLMTADRGLAEDLLQTALLRTWRRWWSIRDVATAPAYVRTAMARELLNLKRPRFDAASL